MKTSKLRFFAYLICIPLLISCWGNIDEPPIDIDDNISAYEPILMSRQQLESSIAIENSRAMNEAGKIYLRSSHIFINDKNEGFHIFNNQDPTNPSAFKFLKAPGSTDIAIRNNILYINQATDLVTLSYTSNYENLTETERIRNIFPPRYQTPDGYFVTYNADSILVGWKLK